MSQTYKPEVSKNISQMRIDFNANDEALRSNFEGENPPSNAVIGQTWFKHSTKTKYIYTGDGPYFSGWEIEANITSIGLEVIKARGSKPSLDERLEISFNPDGTPKAPYTLNVSEWVNPGLTLSYVSSTQFTVAGNHTDIYTANRAIKATLNSSVAYSFVQSSTYDAGQDKTTVVLVDAVLTAELQKVEHGIISNGLPNLDNLLPKATASKAGIVKPGQGLAVDSSGALSVVNNNAVIGLTNYIAEGLKITPGTGLQAIVGTGRSSIAEKVVQLIQAWAQNLDPRMAALLYQNQDGTIGKVNAANPLTFIDNNTVGMWVMNKTGAGEQIPNSAVGLSSAAGGGSLVPTGGLASVDGWFDYAIKGDGSTGYYVSQNSNGFPVGAAERELNVLYTHFSNSGNQSLSVFGSNANLSYFMPVVISGVLNIDVGGTGYSYNTNYSFDIGKTYLISSCYDGIYLTVKVNGQVVFSVAVTLTTVASVLYVGRFLTASNYCSGIVHYVELRNKCRTPAQLGAIANKLCLPCSYVGYSAEYPVISDVDKATAWHEWRCDETSGTTVADIAGTLNGTATGTTIVDSILGLGKARKFILATDIITCGNYAFNGDITVITAGIINAHGTNHIFVSNMDNSDGNVFGINANGNLFYSAYVNGTLADTAVIPVGVPFVAAIVIKSGQAYFYCNSILPNVATSIALKTLSKPLTIGNSQSTAWAANFNGLLEYSLVLPRGISQAEFSTIYNKLMQQKTRTIVDDVLPTNSISLGRVLTGTDKVKEIRMDYQDGRREGAIGGNRRQFLGWKYFSGNQLLSWNNPFGTRKLRLQIVWAQDANGTNECNTYSAFFSGSLWYGIYVGSSYITPSTRIIISTCSDGVCHFNGAFQTSGYLGCYAEVLD